MTIILNKQGMLSVIYCLVFRSNKLLGLQKEFGCE
jgi:hypothetical protein